MISIGVPLTESLRVNEDQTLVYIGGLVIGGMETVITHEESGNTNGKRDVTSHGGYRSLRQFF